MSEYDQNAINTQNAQEGFQTDASMMALWANQKSTETLSANHSTTWKYQFWILSQLQQSLEAGSALSDELQRKSIFSYHNLLLIDYAL